LKLLNKIIREVPDKELGDDYYQMYNQQKIYGGGTDIGILATVPKKVDSTPVKFYIGMTKYPNKVSHTFTTGESGDPVPRVDELFKLIFGRSSYK